MFNGARKRVGLGLAAGLVIASAVGVTSMTSADDIPAVPTITIALEGRAGTITYQPTSGDPVVQSIATVEPCNVTTDGPELLTVTPTASNNVTVQLPSGGLGVGNPRSCGDPAAFVSNGQTLTVGLGSYFLDEHAGFTTSILRADLQILRNGGSSLKATTSGGTSGATAVISSPTDTFTATVEGDFTSITIEPQGGNPAPQRGVSLRGAVFELDPPFAFDTTLLCGDPYSVPGDAETATAATFAEFARLSNGDKNEPGDECQPVGVNLEIRSSTVYWDNSTDGLGGAFQDVRALVTIAWAGVAPEVANDSTLQINYEGTDNDEDFVDAQWCLEYDSDSETGVAPDGIPWCLVSSTSELIGDEVFRTTVFYGAGDPVGRWS